MPSRIVREHVKEYEKKKNTYKKIICGYLITLFLLIAAALFIPCAGTILLMFFIVFAGGLFACPLFTRLTACSNILSIIRKNYPGL